MKRVLLISSVLVALVVLAGCKDSEAPTGQKSMEGIFAEGKDSPSKNREARGKGPKNEGK